MTNFNGAPEVEIKKDQNEAAKKAEIEGAEAGGRELTSDEKTMLVKLDAAEKFFNKLSAMNASWANAIPKDQSEKQAFYKKFTNDPSSVIASAEWNEEAKQFTASGKVEANLGLYGGSGVPMKDKVEGETTIPENFMDEARKAIILRIKLYNEGSAKESTTRDLIELLRDPAAKEKYIKDLARKIMEKGEGVMKAEDFQNKY